MCQVILGGAESQADHPRGKTESFLGHFGTMESSYLKDTKAHFENNKRSKEYTAHQSKVSEKKGGISNVRVT